MPKLTTNTGMAKYIFLFSFGRQMTGKTIAGSNNYLAIPSTALFLDPSMLLPSLFTRGSLKFSRVTERDLWHKTS